MILTSLNFPKGYKENLIKMYGGTNYDSNFKTFYKNDKYNYEIDLNFKNNNKPKLNSIDEDEENDKKKSKSFPKQIKQNASRVKNIDMGVENEYRVIPPFKTKKNSNKFIQKNSPNKYPVLTNNNKISNNNVNAYAFNLPNITLKNFKIKK